MNEGAEGQATLPGHGQVRHVDVPVAFRLPLTPVEQLAGASDGL